MSRRTTSLAGDVAHMRAEKWKVETPSGQGVRPGMWMHIARTCLEFESEKPLNIIPPDKEDEDQDEEVEEGVEEPEHGEEEEEEL
jgi:hypothetical protein